MTTCEPALSLDDALEGLRTLHERWADLEDSRLRGTSRPPLPGAQMSETAREEMDRRARTERAEVDDRAPGYSMAPLHIDVLDTMADILMSADLLHEHVAQTVGHPTLDHPASAYADARPYLAYVIELLPEACETDPDMLEAAWERVESMRSALLMSLGEIYDGQRLSAVCPFCVGRTFKRWAGERTMRIRIRETPTPQHPDACEPIVVCENPDGLCQPFAKEVDIWHLGRPAWRYPRWAWLAERLHPTRGETVA